MQKLGEKALKKSLKKWTARLAHTPGIASTPGIARAPGIACTPDLARRKSTHEAQRHA